MLNAAPLSRGPRLRDPAWSRRLALMLALPVLLWPLLVATEFRPWLLWQPESLRLSGRFLSDFWPPAHGADFLLLVAQESWRTVAMATVGVFLGLLLAAPLALLASSSLSVSALSGRMASGPMWLRHAVRLAAGDVGADAAFGACGCHVASPGKVPSTIAARSLRPGHMRTSTPLMAQCQL